MTKPGAATEHPKKVAFYQDKVDFSSAIRG
jgi:hypothetical protein